MKNLHPNFKNLFSSLFGAELVTTKQPSICPVCREQINEFDETVVEFDNEIHKECILKIK